LDKDNRHFIVAGCTGEKAFVIEAGQRSPTTTTYDVHQAEAQADRQRYVLDEVRQQVGLQVWTTFQALRAASENVTNSATLLDVAQRSYVAAERRYQIGVGSILELLNAQSALAEAKRQRIQALTDWRSERLQLAEKLGRLGMWDVLPGK